MEFPLSPRINSSLPVVVDFSHSLVPVASSATEFSLPTCII